MNKDNIIFTCYAAIFFYFLLSLFSSFQVPINWDSSIIIDGSYRLSLGQAPHTDFSINTGFLTYLLGSLGIFIGINWSYASIYFGFYIFYLLTICFTTYRFSNFQNINFVVIVLIIFTSALAFTHRMEGYEATTLGHTGLYNHLGHFLITILSLNIFRILSERNKNIDKKDLFFIAIILTCLFIGKITFFLVSMPIAAFILIKGMNAYIKTMLLTLLLIGLVYFALGIKVVDVLSDFKLLKVNGDTLNKLFSFKTIKYHLFGTPFQYYLAIIIVTIGYIRINAVSILQGIILCLSVIILSYCLSVTNGQKPEPFLPILYSLIFIMYFGFMLAKKKYQSKFTAHYKGLILPLLVSSYLISGHIVLNTKGHLDFISYNTYSLLVNYNDFITKIKPVSGYHIDCIEPHIKSNSQILSVGSNNIYNYYFNLRPAKRTLLYWHEGVTFNENRLSTSNEIFLPENVFSEINLIFLNKTQHYGSVAMFQRIYKDYISKNFIEVSNTDDCIIFRRVE